MIFQTLIAAENARYNDQQSQPTSRLCHGPLPSKWHVLKFKLADFFENIDDEGVAANPADVVVDFVVVHGNSVTSLVVQTFAKPVKDPTAVDRQVSVLIDAMAAFCRVKSASGLHRITTFKSKAASA